MGFTPADEHAIRAVRIEYRPDPDSDRGVDDRRAVDEANEILSTVAQGVCDALRTAFGATEELRELVPLASYDHAFGNVSVRLVLIVCTDQMVHVVFAGSETGVQQHQFPYGTLDAEAKVFTVVPQLTSKNGRPVLVMPRLKGSEKKWDDMFRWPPQMRNPNLASGPSAPVPGWYVDPTARHQLRYWDGAAWTATAADNGQSVIDPM